MKKRCRKTTPSIPAPAHGPTLLEFWTALKAGASVEEASGRAPASAAAVPRDSAPAAVSPPNAPTDAAAPAPGRFSSGESSGSGFGSGGGGYGLRLIAPDPAEQERIRRIMRELCEKDAKRGKQ